MFWIFILIPLVTVIAALLLYRQVGKRDFLKLDIVQFAYAFIFSPVAFVWIKSLLQYLTRSEIGLKLTQNQLFLLDTAFSLIFLYFFAFVVIHSLTKTFEVKLQRDPLFDILEHSEKFHLWISHTSIYTLCGLMLLLLAMLNLSFPLDVPLQKPQFFLLLAAGLATGAAAYVGIWLSNFTKSKFLRLVKLIYGIYFVILVAGYFSNGPSFSGSYAIFWFISMCFSAIILSSQAIDRSPKSKTWLRKLHHKHKEGWSDLNFLLIQDKKTTTKK